VAVDATSTQPGGGQSYLSQQLRLAEMDDLDLTIFATRETAMTWSSLIGARVELVPTQRILRVAYVHLCLSYIAKRRGATVLYCPGSVAPLFSSLPRVILIQNPHLFVSPAPRSARLTALRVLSWSSVLRSTLVGVQTRQMCCEFRRHSGLAIVPIVVRSGFGAIYHPTPERLERLDSDGQYLLTVSNLYAYKRIDLTIRAYAILSDSVRKRWRLIIAGAEGSRGIAAKLQALVIKLGVQEEVVFMGFVEKEELAALYSKASLYVNLSSRESLGLTPAEALVHGTPVLLSDIPVFRETYGTWANFSTCKDPSSVALDIERSLSEGRRVDLVNARKQFDSNGKEIRRLLELASRKGIPSLATVIMRVRIRPAAALRVILGTKGVS